MKTPQKVFLILLVAIFAWSAWKPHDYFTWFLEVAPILLGIIALALTDRRFRFTSFVYYLMGLHAVILIIGAHYTYAEVPLFNWIRDEFGLARNHYDRLGHFVQGFFPAMIVREVLIRVTPLKKGGWLFFLTLCVCFSISAFYELIEWWAAVSTGTMADAFLGSQGDVWDSQWDMFLCLIGATLSLLLLSAPHDRALAKLKSKRKA